MIYREEIVIATEGHRDMHEITNRVQAVADRSGISEGTVHIFNVGSTGIVGTIEYEPGLEKDLPDMLDRLIPPSLDYGHERQWHDGNGHSHLQATLTGPEITVPLAAGKLLLGTWQQVFHLEADIKPRKRRVVVTVMGE
ncbi:secondary thiamine-phosphate synthase enzyme YjbQ [Pontiella sp.]|uniref:secondary thiamine-phosphate synthase enzyme YjbQ n=1 Tax=Pontiella sp. TaxID=2837462 RepID=UPI003565976C